jgi:hypothetical protein
VFAIAKEVFTERSNVESVELELKMRRGRSAVSSAAADLHDLYVYVVNSDALFPKDVLKQCARLVEIQCGDKAAEREAIEKVASGYGDIVVVQLTTEIQELRKEVDMLKSNITVLSLEKDAEKAKWQAQFDNLLSQLAIGGILSEQHIDSITGRHLAEQASIPAIADPVQERRAAVIAVPGERPSSRVEHVTPAQQPVGDVTARAAESQARKPDEHVTRARQPANDVTSRATQQQAQHGEQQTHEQQRPAEGDDFPVLATPQDDRSGHQAPPPGRPQGSTNEQSENNAASEKQTFSEAARKPGTWKTVSYQRNNNIIGRACGETKDLKGVPVEKAKRIYLRNVYVNVDDREAEIKERVRKYAVARGLRIMGINIVTNRYIEDVVGCKMLVPEPQLSKALAPDFWPENTNCRLWYEKPNGRHNGFRNGSKDNYSQKGNFRSSRSDERYENNTWE